MTTAQLELASKMNEYGDAGGRLKGVTVMKPIVYGNIAHYFGKKREEDGHTHQWTIYLKPYKNECLSTFVKKVHFKLHESYPNSTRVITKPPYEVTETGWGEFEISIKVYFQDPNERPVTLYHLLKLFQSETDIMLGKKSLVAESYDELIFQDPTSTMQHYLNLHRPVVLGNYKHDTDFDERKQRQASAILSAKNKVRHEIQELNEKLKQSKHAIHKFKTEIAKLEQQEDETVPL